MTQPVQRRRAARARILDAADELFYNQGIHTVGIDRVIERAGVAKATLYTVFGSKDELIRAYLTRRHAGRQARITRELGRFTTPRDRLLGVFDIIGELAAESGFRGCAFLNASAETPAGSTIEQVSDTTRAWVRTLFVRLASDAGATDAEQLGGQLVILYDGATVGSKMDRDPGAAANARTVAAVLLDAAVSS